MKKNKKGYRSVSQIIVFSFLLIIGISCNDNSPIAPTNNLQEYFKYSVNGGTERVFDSYATGSQFASNTTSNTNPFEKFTFRAGAETINGGSIIVDGSFIFPSFTTLPNTTSFSWGSFDGSTPTTAKFYFSEITTAGFIFLPHPLNSPNNPIICTVTAHANSIGNFMEFSFTGAYIDATDSSGSTTGTVSGEGRIRRKSDL